MPVYPVADSGYREVGGVIPSRTADHSRYLRVLYPDGNPDSVDPPPEHLGGGRRRCHMDPGALVWLIERYGITSMLDVGCGLGGMVEYSRELGITATGIDGDKYCSPDILWDFTNGPCEAAPAVDLVWSMEFVEHVDQRFIANFMATFRKAPVAAITFAPPGKKGRHHVNCQLQPYWVQVFLEHGMEFDEEATEGFRLSSEMRSVECTGVVNQRKRKPFVRKYGMILRRL